MKSLLSEIEYDQSALGIVVELSQFLYELELKSSEELMSALDDLACNFCSKCDRHQDDCDCSMDDYDIGDDAYDRWKDEQAEREFNNEKIYEKIDDED
jgi:hypothetical protein